MNSNQFVAELLLDAVMQTPPVFYLPLLASIGLIVLERLKGSRSVAAQGLKILALSIAACLVFLALGLTFTLGLIAGDPGGSVHFFSLLFLGLSAASYVLMLPGIIYTAYFGRSKKQGGHY